MKGKVIHTLQQQVLPICVRDRLRGYTAIQRKNTIYRYGIKPCQLLHQDVFHSRQ